MRGSSDPPVPTVREDEIAETVRQNAFPSAIGALCLLYFGFFQLARPTGTDLFSLANLIFFYVLRVGGVFMALIALTSWAGLRAALIIDAVISVTIGALFVVTAVMMLIDGGGGLNTFLIIIFGIMFASAGLRNSRAFFALAPQNADRMQTKSVAPPGYSSQAGRQPDDSLAGRLLTTRQSGGAVGSEASPGPISPALRGVQVGDTEENAAVWGVEPNDNVIGDAIDDAGDDSGDAGPAPSANAEDDSPPPEGFLASFAPRTPEGKQP